MFANCVNVGQKPTSHVRALICQFSDWLTTKQEMDNEKRVSLNIIDLNLDVKVQTTTTCSPLTGISNHLLGHNHQLQLLH